ncbi:MAG: cell division protein FtsX [Vicinamibacterales bacterium]
MRLIRYAFREGWTSLVRSGTSTLFSVTAIALAVAVLAAVLLFTTNVERWLDQWSSSAELSVYLDDGTTSDERGAIEDAIEASGIAASREYVSKQEALARFRDGFSSLSPLAEGLDGNPFPASVEVRLAPGDGVEAALQALARQLLTLPGVVDVQYDRDWLNRLAAGLDVVRRLGFLLGLLMALAATVTVAAVVRLSLYSRRDEIEVMQLVGAPVGYIRGPFVAEGVLQGGLGALAALAVLGAGFALVRSLYGTALAQVLEGLPVGFLPPAYWAYLILGGMVVGAAGGFVAARQAV